VPIRKTENRYALPGAKWSPLAQSDAAIDRTKREIRESKAALKTLVDPIYRAAELAFLQESEACLERHLVRRQRLEARLNKQRSA
jgi:hypothetical protein